MKTKTYLFIIALLFSQVLLGQEEIKVKEIDSLSLPKSMEYKGVFKKAFRWTDKSGDHIVITTETGEYPSKNRKEKNIFRDAELFAYHFTIQNGRIAQTWKFCDLIRDCPVEIVLNFIEKPCIVTDLDNDGKGEIWLMYHTVCHGDVSPSEMKIILYRDQRKYEMTGQNKLIMADNKVYGGDYQFDRAFMEGPKLYRDFAEKLWENNHSTTRY